MMNGQQPLTYDGNTPVTITLPLNNWALVRTLLGEAPWKTANPIIGELDRQIGVALEHVEPIQQQPGGELRQ
jgi:hypothetical protein